MEGVDGRFERPFGRVKQGSIKQEVLKQTQVNRVCDSDLRI